MVINIYAGENLLLQRDLKDADGNNLLLSSLTSLRVDILQDEKLITTYYYPSGYFRQGATNSQVEIEVSTEISTQLRRGNLSFRYTITAPNTEFTAEGSQIDIFTETPVWVSIP